MKHKVGKEKYSEEEVLGAILDSLILISDQITLLLRINTGKSASELAKDLEEWKQERRRIAKMEEESSMSGDGEE